MISKNKTFVNRKILILLRKTTVLKIILILRKRIFVNKGPGLWSYFPASVTRAVLVVKLILVVKPLCHKAML